MEAQYLALGFCEAGGGVEVFPFYGEQLSGILGESITDRAAE